MKQVAKCFVIMPFGTKMVGDQEVDFEFVYQEIIKKAVSGLDSPTIHCERSKDDPKSGIVSEHFARSILESDIAIIDVSGNNPNVYYELGLRHAMRSRINILIGMEGAKLPFDVAGLQVLHYDHLSDAGRQTAIGLIRNQIKQAFLSEHIDSPIYKYLPTLSVSLPDKVIRQTQFFDYGSIGDGPMLGYVTGALTDVRGIDVWVNSENAQLEMARPYERSISSLVRYYGSVRNGRGEVQRDIIQLAIRKKVPRGTSVAPATVVATTPGQLRERGVRQLLHVASVEGQPGLGYRPVQDIGACVTSAVVEIDRLNRRPFAPKLRSVLIPIFGTGTGAAKVEDVLDQLVSAAANHFARCKSHIQKLYFLAYTERQQAACHRALNKVVSASSRKSTADRKWDWDALEIGIADTLFRAKHLRRDDSSAAMTLLQSAIAAITDDQWMALLIEDGGDVEKKRKFAARLVDCFGLLGGQLRRLNRIYDAVPVFRRGQVLEESTYLNLAWSYNMVNALVAQLEADAPIEPLEFDGEIHYVISVVERQIAQQRSRDCWAYADLGLCSVLGRDQSRAEFAYKRFLEFGYPEAFQSAGAVLASLLERLEAKQDDRVHQLRACLAQLRSASTIESTA